MNMFGNPRQDNSVVNKHKKSEHPKAIVESRSNQCAEAVEDRNLDISAEDLKVMATDEKKKILADSLKTMIARWLQFCRC